MRMIEIKDKKWKKDILLRFMQMKYESERISFYLFFIPATGIFRVTRTKINNADPNSFR